MTDETQQDLSPADVISAATRPATDYPPVPPCSSEGKPQHKSLHVPSNLGGPQLSVVTLTMMRPDRQRRLMEAIASRSDTRCPCWHDQRPEGVRWVHLVHQRLGGERRGDGRCQPARFVVLAEWSGASCGV